MAFTADDLVTIDAAIAAGEFSIRLGDMAITYRSMDDLIKARETIVADLDRQASAARPYPRHQLADFSDDED